MKLSIVIACFNAADTIATQLEALANQHWSKPWEVIVSNNGSTDESMAIVEQYRQQLPNLRIVDASTRQGSPYAVNVGVRTAAGEAMAFCDADDEVAPGWVAAIGEALSEHDFVAGRLEIEKLNKPWLQKVRANSQQDGLAEYHYPPYLPHAAGCNLGMKRSLYETIGEFDESLPYLFDTDYCWRVQLAGTKLHFVPAAVVHYRYRDTLGGLYRQGLKYSEYNVLLYKRYRSRGMPEISLKWGLRAWLSLLYRLPQIRHFEGRAAWLWSFAWSMGRLQGSLKHRVLAL